MNEERFFLPESLEFSFCTTKPIITLVWEEELLYYLNNCNFYNDLFDSDNKIAFGRPTQKDWLEFWDKINDLDVWSWQKHYKYRGLRFYDNYKWHLIIICNYHKIESFGSNSFPPNGLNQPTDDFITLINTFIDLGNSIC